MKNNVKQSIIHSVKIVVLYCFLLSLGTSCAQNLLDTVMNWIMARTQRI